MDAFPLHSALYALAFLEADSGKMAEQQQWFAGKPDYENFGLAVITENLVCMPTPSAGEKEKMIEAALKWRSNRVLDRKAGNAKRNPVSAREEIALVYKTTGCYRTR